MCRFKLNITKIYAQKSASDQLLHSTLHRQHDKKHKPRWPTSIHRVWHPAAARPGPPLCLSSSSSFSSLQGTQSFSERRPPRYLYPGHAKGSFTCCRWLLDRLQVEKSGIILWADVKPSEWDRTGLGYGSSKVDAEIHPCSLCPLHTLWRRRSRPPHHQRSCCCSNNFTHQQHPLSLKTKWHLGFIRPARQTHHYSLLSIIMLNKYLHTPVITPKVTVFVTLKIYIPQA